MRLMSFSLTTPQMHARAKTITRRLGWLNLRPGDIVMAVEKCMGLKRGEQVKKIGPIRIVSVGFQPLCSITAEDVIAEGFPAFSPSDFVAFFCKQKAGLTPSTPVNRIVFEFVD